VNWVERKITTADGKTYIEVVIKTACCRKMFLLEIRPNGYYDVERLEMVEAGYKSSIDQALKEFNAQEIRKTP
jgi:hypothetical protein